MRNLTVTFIAIAMFALSCKKNEAAQQPYTCQTCKTAPDALAANDASSKGVYKGVVIGSSGTIMFDILNSGTTIKATLVLDGVTSILTSNVTWVSGNPYVGNFTGTINGSAVSINFSVDANGANAIVLSANIPGHPNASFSVIKETSSNLVECFEGTYSTTLPETGTFNILLSRTAKIYGGQSRKTGSTTSKSISTGPINSQNQLLDNSGKVMGTLNGDVLTGSFVDNNGSTVTINANRTW